MCEPGSREIRAPRETDCGINGSAEPLRSRRRPMSTSLLWNLSTYELPVVIEDGMSGRSGQRKPGTARGSPRRSRTAKASRISRRAVKSRCAREWGGWGRLSDDGPGQHNRRRQYGWRGPAGERPAREGRSGPLGSECCVSRRQRRPRSVHSNCMGCLLSHEIVSSQGRRLWLWSNATRVVPLCEALPPCRGRGTHHVQRDCAGNWEIPRPTARSRAAGPHREGEEP